MYQNIIITIVAATVLFWFLYSERIFTRIFHKVGKKTSDSSAYHPSMVYEVFNNVQPEFGKGNFQHVINLADKLLADVPFEAQLLSYKAYALFHLKKYAEAKEVFLLLDTLPNQDCKKMLDKINDLLTA